MTHADLKAEIAPVRGKLDLLGQRVETIEKAHNDHLSHSSRQDDKLRDVEDWVTEQRVQLRMLSRIFGTSVVAALVGLTSLLVSLYTLSDIVRRIGT